MKILVVGGNGFIGKHILDKANNLNWETTNLSLNNDTYKNSDFYIKSDVSNLDNLRKNIGDKTYDYVINCGGYVDHSNFDINGIDIINTHFNGVMNLIHSLDKINLKKFINIGTGDEYGLQKSPFKEELRENPHTPYSFSKTAASHFLQMLNKNEKIPTLTIRVLLVYGPGQKNNRFVPQVINGCLKDESFPTSRGDQIRDFLYIDDLIDAIFLALHSEAADGHILNIGSGKPLKIKDLIEVIQKKISKGMPIYGKIPYRDNENMSIFTEIKKAKALLNWEPKVSLDDGIKRTINYYREQK